MSLLSEHRDERDRKIRKARRDVDAMYARKFDHAYRLLVDDLCRNAPDTISAACERLNPPTPTEDPT